jgi:hypothetical protein
MIGRTQQTENDSKNMTVKRVAITGAIITRRPEQNHQKRINRRGQTELDCQNRTTIKGLPGQKSQVRITRTVQPAQGSLDRTARRSRQRQDRHDRTARTGGGEDSQQRAARTKQSRQVGHVRKQGQDIQEGQPA